MKMRKLICLMLVLVCTLAFSTTAYAGGDDPNPTEIVQPEPEPTAEPQPLTPEGNMSLVDDIDGEAGEDRQFITVTTKNGNYFYIIIDRATDGENTVHFLNQVDERDLLALMEDEESDATPTCACADKCVAGAVNTACPVCKTDMTQCMGKEVAPPADPEPEIEPEPEPEEKAGGMGSIVVVILIIALLGGGAFYYFKFIKNKPSAKGQNDLDDYDFGDEDEDDEQDDEPDEDATDEDDFRDDVDDAEDEQI
ncbi:DUF4366 domain-containing protein [Christensenellaceae bacterium OttesenSCG-928-L17]|nr:DUF4366 domain-containing protein [Christensenellaceae bacterium OttesenSCG-928-L17]